MLVQATKYMRAKNIVPAGRYLKKDSFGTERTQERRRPDRTDVVPVQKRNKPFELVNTTINWLAVIILLAFILFHPLTLGGLALIVWLVARAVNDKTVIVRYFVVGIMAFAGTWFIQITTSPFASCLLPVFAFALTVFAARQVQIPEDEQLELQPLYKFDTDDDIIEAEVISVTTIEPKEEP